MHHTISDILLHEVATKRWMALSVHLLRVVLRELLRRMVVELAILFLVMMSPVLAVLLINQGIRRVSILR